MFIFIWSLNLQIIYNFFLVFEIIYNSYFLIYRLPFLKVFVPFL